MYLNTNHKKVSVRSQEDCMRLLYEGSVLGVECMILHSANSLTRTLKDSVVIDYPVFPHLLCQKSCFPGVQ